MKIPDPIVRLGDPMEPFSWSWEGRLSAFFADNAGSFSDEEVAEITRVVLAGETYEEGGGAAPEWTLWAVQS